MLCTFKDQLFLKVLSGQIFLDDTHKIWIIVHPSLSIEIFVKKDYQIIKRSWHSLHKTHSPIHSPLGSSVNANNQEAATPNSWDRSKASSGPGLRVPCSQFPIHAVEQGNYVKYPTIKQCWRSGLLLLEWFLFSLQDFHKIGQTYPGAPHLPHNKNRHHIIIY